jgi:hypothetical protein
MTSAIAISFPIIACLACSSSRRDDDSADIPAIKAVADQNEAIRLARDVDLPILEKADRVVLEESAIDRGHRRVILEDEDDIKRLRKSLKPRDVPPSGGMVALRLSFFRGKVPLREVWVFEGGEWGFERPGTSWTTGGEADLWKTLRTLMK